MTTVSLEDHDRIIRLEADARNRDDRLEKLERDVRDQLSEMSSDIRVLIDRTARNEERTHELSIKDKGVIGGISAAIAGMISLLSYVMASGGGM